MKEFSAEILFRKGGVVDTYWYVLVPFNVEQEFNRKGFVPVKVTFGGIPYRASLIPAGNDIHLLRIRKLILKQLGKQTGSVVRVTLEKDSPKRTVTTPADLTRALAKNPAAKKEYAKAPYSTKREIIVQLDISRHPATRARKIEHWVEVFERKAKVKRQKVKEQLR